MKPCPQCTPGANCAACVRHEYLRLRLRARQRRFTPRGTKWAAELMQRKANADIRDRANNARLQP
jgi:hypothetical protein